jgi:hypothetical protein
MVYSMSLDEVLRFFCAFDHSIIIPFIPLVRGVLSLPLYICSRSPPSQQANPHLLHFVVLAPAEHRQYMSYRRHTVLHEKLYMIRGRSRSLK